MKKMLTMILAAVMLLSLAVFAHAQEPAGPFEPGSDTTEYVVDGSSGWNTETVFVKIAAGDDVLYNGSVKITSDTLFVSEVTYAAVVEAGISQDGILSGFVNSIGDYASGADAEGNYLYWGYTVNGKYVPFGCNQMRVLEGDYVLWEFQTYSEEAAAAAPLPTGITAPFEVGTDATEYVVDGSSGWNTETINVKIIAGEDVLYNGTVKLTSDTLFVSEATYAAIVEAGISQDGVLSGFVTSIGDYASGADAEGNYLYWGYGVNGKYVPFSCNEMPVLDGDYILWEFLSYNAG